MNLAELLAQIAELNGNINDLNAEQCAELKGLVGEAADAFPTDRDLTPEEAAQLEGLADVIEAADARATAVEEQTTAARAAVEAAHERIAQHRAKASDEDAPGDGDGGGDDAGDGAAKPEGEDADAETADADAVKEGALVASDIRPKAYRSGPSAMGGKPVNISPELQPANRVPLVAAANLDGIPSGERLDHAKLLKAMQSVVRRMTANGDTGRVLVASSDYSDLFPEDRKLRVGQEIDNTRKMEALENVVASGGIPQPYNVAYDLDVEASEDTPFADGCGSVFHAERGGLTYRQPLSVGSLTTSTGVWTAAVDASPGGATKSIYTAAPLTSTSTTVNAITTRLQIGNLMGQFDPESIAMFMDLSAAATSRQREIELLTLLQAAAGVNTITSAKILGESRDWLATVFQTAARFRYVNRLKKDKRLVVVLPAYIQTIMNIDRMYELAHGQTGNADVFMLPQSYWDDVLATENIRAIWTEDALTANAGAGTYTSQQLADFVTGSLQAFPTAIMWNMYLDGQVQRLDAGLLNLGVVRDSILDGTNDYEIFREVFEGLAYRGPTNMLLQVVSTTHATGASSAGVTVS